MKAKKGKDKVRSSAADDVSSKDVQAPSVGDTEPLTEIDAPSAISPSPASTVVPDVPSGDEQLHAKQTALKAARAAKAAKARNGTPAERASGGSARPGG
jgi:hypothetical protein